MSTYVERRSEPIGTTFLAVHEFSASRLLKRSHSFGHVAFWHKSLVEQATVPLSQETDKAVRIKKRRADRRARQPRLPNSYLSGNASYKHQPDAIHGSSSGGQSSPISSQCLCSGTDSSAQVATVGVEIEMAEKPDRNRFTTDPLPMPRCDGPQSTLVEGNEVTFCVRNIPKSTTTRELARKILLSGLVDHVDFVYVPQGSNAFDRQRSNHKRPEGLGYGFVNFTQRHAAFELLKVWHQMPVFVPHTLVSVSLATTQGRALNEKLFSFGKAGRIRNPMLRPLVLRTAAGGDENIAASF